MPCVWAAHMGWFTLNDRSRINPHNNLCSALFLPAGLQANMAPHQMSHPLALQSIGQYGTLPKHMGGHMMDAIRVLPPGPHPGMATLGRKSEPQTILESAFARLLSIKSLKFT